MKTHSKIPVIFHDQRTNRMRVHKSKSSYTVLFSSLFKIQLQVFWLQNVKVHTSISIAKVFWHASVFLVSLEFSQRVFGLSCQRLEGSSTDIHL